VGLVIWQIASAAAPAIERQGLEPLASSKWDGKSNFGIQPEIWGTLYSSILGVGIGALFGVAVVTGVICQRGPRALPRSAG
jgi:phosphate transport system permease protein